MKKEKKNDLVESTRKADNVVINMELYSYIRSIKDRYIQAMLTNYPREWFEIGQKKWPELMEVYDHIITSFEVKLRKPDPKIYQLTLDRIGCKAEEAVEEAVKLANDAGARKAITLAVSVPSHCKMMKPASSSLSSMLDAININTPQVPIVNNADAAFLSEADQIKDSLIRQLNGSLLWEDSIKVYFSQSE